MKISLSWLKEFVELPATVAELTELLTRAGVEVEGIHTRGVNIEHVVVAQITESVPHPNADRLSVCKVDDGSDTARQIVCGAKNYQLGDKVPLALPGAVLPGDFKIKVGKLRGVESEGMLCSAKELALAEDADGLLILPPAARVGAPLSELFPADTVLDLEITPNRADLLSYRGIAREVAASTGQTLRYQTLGADAQDSSAIHIAARERCPFYSARKISGVKIAPSPAWLREKLEASGLRAINNLVDATNFVMLETGQPLHAFDAEKIHGNLRVRAASEGEALLALDGKNYLLAPDDLVIADEQSPLALAGVMGGEPTGVTQTTTDVLLESAYFSPAGIRRTSRRLGLISDSSYRFERGVDPESVLAASQRAADLIVELAGGTAEPSAQTAGSIPDFRRAVTLRKGRCTQVAGTEVPGPFIAETLKGFGLTTAGDHVWHVPSFRQDLTREIDLIEEVVRVFGIEKIPARETSRYFSESPADREHERRMEICRTLVGLGFYECRTLSLVDDSAAENCDEVIRVRNPLTADQTTLRPTLTMGVSAALARNARAGQKSMRLFELGRAFHRGEVEEPTQLALMMTGPIGAKSWRADASRDADIFDVKGILASLGLGELAFESFAHPAFALGALVKLDGKPIGCIGQLIPAKARTMDVTTPVVMAEVALPPANAVAKRFAEVSRFPAITRDIALLAAKTTSHAQLADVLQSVNEPLLAGAELFDVFSDPSGEKVPPGQKSLAYSLTYRATGRTLTADEVNAAHARLKERLKAALNVTFRE